MFHRQSTTIKLPFSKNFSFFLAIFIPAMAIRCWFLLSMDETILFFKYPYFAEKLASGESIGNRLTDLSPVYLYLLSLFRWLTPFDWGLFKFIQAVIGAINCWLAAELGQRVFSNRAVGLMAGLALAAYGNLIILETTLEPTVFVIFFNLLAIYFLYRHADSKGTFDKLPGHRWLLLSALFTGISIITKPSFLLFIPLACIWIIIKTGRVVPVSKTVVMLTLFCAVSFSIVFAITLRNYLLLDDIILVTADAGKVFFHGNSREATVLKWAGLPDQGFIEENSDEPDFAHVAFRSVASKMSGRVLTPSESSKFWTRRTLTDIAADPNRYLRRQLDKFLFFFSDYELHYIASAYKEYKDSLSIPFLRFSWIIALGIVGMVMTSGQFTRLLPFYGMILLYLVSGLVYVVQSRYRIPTTPYFCLFAAFAIHRLFQLLRTKRFAVLLTALGSITAAYLLSNTLLNEKIKGIDNWFQATKLHYEMDARVNFRAGKYSEAIDAATRALSREPAFAPAYNLRGKSYAMIADNPAAIKDFTKVIRLHPNHAEGYRNLGFSYFMNNDPENAIIYLEKSLGLNPGDKKVLDTLERLKEKLAADH
jgi:tetratricopeptide (TPR) repeat protein